jgi:hypothetical protein
MIRFPSLEINWLPNSFLKGLDSVKIDLVSEALGSGAYYHGQNLITITEDGDSIYTASTIAHEMRHHWQHTKFGSPKNYVTWKSLSPFSYEVAIVKFFTSNPIEMDALLFEYKIARTDLNTYWMDLIHDFFQNPKVE